MWKQYSLTEKVRRIQRLGVKESIMPLGETIRKMYPNAGVNLRGTGVEAGRPALCMVKGKDTHALSHCEEWCDPRMKGNQRRMGSQKKVVLHFKRCALPAVLSGDCIMETTICHSEKGL